MKSPPPPPPGLRAERRRVGDTELVVLSWPSGASFGGARAAHLSPAEREIARLLVAGCTDKEIAAARGVSIRTVSKQVTAVYRKLGVSSRRELWASFGGAPR